jgi:NTE family protein
MGCVIGSLYSIGYSPDGITEIAEHWRSRTYRLIEWQFWKMCMINERALRKVLFSYYGDKTVNRTNIPFWANAVDIEASEEYAIRDGMLVDCLRSSIALPGLLPPYSRPPRLLVDSGIMNPVPAVLLREMGCNYAVAINAMAAPGTTEMSARYPFNAFSVMMKCMFVMGHEIGQRAEQAANIVFTPDLSGISLLQFKRSPEIIERGKRAAEERMPSILSGYQRLKEALERQELDRPHAETVR